MNRERSPGMTILWQFRDSNREGKEAIVADIEEQLRRYQLEKKEASRMRR
jgi:competence protein ComGC